MNAGRVYVEPWRIPVRGSNENLAGNPEKLNFSQTFSGVRMGVGKFDGTISVFVLFPRVVKSNVRETEEE